MAYFRFAFATKVLCNFNDEADSGGSWEDTSEVILFRDQKRKKMSNTKKPKIEVETTRKKVNCVVLVIVSTPGCVVFDKTESVLFKSM